MIDLSSQLNPSGCGNTLYLTPDLSKRDTRDKESIVLCSSLDYECGDKGLPLCSICSTKRLATAKALYNEKKKEYRVLAKIDDIWAESGVEDHNGILLNRIHTIICNRVTELKSEIKQIENEVPEVKDDN